MILLRALTMCPPRRPRRAAALLAVLLATLAPRAGAAQEDTRPRCTEQRHDTLSGRNCLFLHAPWRADLFFPRTGTFTY